MLPLIANSYQHAHKQTINNIDNSTAASASQAQHPTTTIPYTILPNLSMMFKKRQKKSSIEKVKGMVVEIEDISQQLIPITGAKRFAVILHNILSPEECLNLWLRAEKEGFDDALITGPGGKQILRQDIRSCGRCIIDDAGLAEAIYVRIMNSLKGTTLENKVMHAPWITSKGGNNNNTSSNDAESITAVGLNERMRFVKYEPGHFFAPHQDLRFVRGPDAGPNAGETSHITVQLYLNDKFKGGTTRFLCGKRYYDVKPRTGSVLLFDHDLLHEGSKVTGGIKYSVRTDIMFTSKQQQHQSGSSRTVRPDK